MPFCEILHYSLQLNIAIIAEMENALSLIPTILNHLLINVLDKSKENTFSAIFYSHQHAQKTISAIFSIYRIKVFYSIF
jgi:hypothetical protein